MKRLFLLSAIALITFSCQRAESQQEEINPESSLCNKTVNSNSTVNQWGVLSRTTCKPGPGEEASTLKLAGRTGNPLLVSDPNSTAKGATTKACHFWFYGTSSLKLFKPVTYARVFVFNDDATDVAKINSAKAQILTGNHYLGFDTGVFKDIYPLYVLNINHKQNATTGVVL